jgi:hypothetical protein
MVINVTLSVLNLALPDAVESFTGLAKSVRRENRDSGEILHLAREQVALLHNLLLTVKASNSLLITPRTRIRKVKV